MWEWVIALMGVQFGSPSSDGVHKKEVTKSTQKDEQEKLKRMIASRDTKSDENNSKEDFGLSMLVGYSSDSSALGGAVGGSFAGGVMGQSLRDSTESSHSTSSHCDTSSHSHSHSHSHDYGSSSSSYDSSSSSTSYDSGSSSSGCDTSGW